MLGDIEYLNIILGPIRVCRTYRPKFGHGSGYSLQAFQELYRTDPFYAWFGLDSTLMYTAHRAAGGMTSIYRQIGIGCQRLIQQILMDQLGLTAQEASWAYQIKSRGGKRRTLALDARMELTAISNRRRRAQVSQWLRAASRELGVDSTLAKILKGCVFEIRQGYKSKDSKRQQADLSNASAAYSAAYLPVIILLSTQIDEDVAERYHNARWLILRGATIGAATNSTYAFCRDVLGYDLAAFFERNASQLKTEVEDVLKVLLR
jgi:hypothetical protein